MANKYAVNPPLLDADFTRTNLNKEFVLGTEVQADTGTTFRYVKADAAKTASLAYGIDGSDNLTAGLTTTTAGAGPFKVGFPQQAMAINEYGWVAVRGPMTVTVAASCAADVPLYTTATAGVLDDTATTLVQGIKLTTGIGGVQATAPANATSIVRV